MRQILVESSYGSIWREIMEGITWYAGQRRLPWQIHCVTTAELPAALRQRPDGALCLLRHAQRGLIRRLTASRVPAVNLMRDLHPSLPSVMSDNHLIGTRAADYLHGQGFRRFHFAGVDRIWSHQRETGFRTRLQALGHTLESCPLPLKITSLRTGASEPTGLHKWLFELPKPAALFAAADFVGRILVEACTRARLAVPEEVAILGVDNDLAICDLTSVPLSSLPQNMRRIGFEAARLLEGLMHRRRHPRGPLKIAPREVVVRRSTDFIAIDNPPVAAALRLIRNTDVQHLSMQVLLRQAGISRQWLDRQFRATLGSTPSQEIRRQKLAAARALLLESHLPVQTIARRSGFTQGENLSRFFKAHLGLSPRAFRQQYGFVE